MNKKMRELKALMERKLAEAREALDSGDVTKSNELMSEYAKAKGEYESEKAVYEAEKAAGLENTVKMETVKDVPKIAPEKSAFVKFGEAAKLGFPKNLNETTDTEGGYTVPEDVVNTIYELRDAEFSLRDEVTVENVTTNKGKRTYKNRADMTGFVKVDEAGKIPKAEEPTFAIVEYLIEKYGGYFPVTNELLEDSVENIANVLVNWIAGESRATVNKNILDEIKTTFTEATDLKDLDGIKKAVNVTLGAAFRGLIKIYTNDDGLQYLDTLKDQNGRYLLSPNPVDPMQLTLGVGAQRIPIVVIPNAVLKTEETKVPFIIGSMKDAIVFYERRGYNIKSSDTASVTGINAFEQDMTIWRALEREDVVTKDKGALVNGYITVTAAE